MYSLAKILEQGHREKEREKERERARERERNEQQTSESLVRNTTNEPEVQISQPHAESSINQTIVINNVAQASYDSIEEDTNSANTADNKGKFNCAAAILFLLLYVMPIFLVVFGSIHLKDCPAQKMIPISFIVWGTLALVSRILSVPEECRKIFNNEKDLEINAQTICRVGLNLLVQIVTTCMFIALCVWIFKVHPDYEEGSPNYCVKELYDTAYYLCLVILSLIGIAFAFACCGGCIAGCIVAAKTS